MLWTIIRKARNHCQDVDNCGDEDLCQYHLGIDHCQLLMNLFTMLSSSRYSKKLTIGNVFKV